MFLFFRGPGEEVILLNKETLEEMFSLTDLRLLFLRWEMAKNFSWGYQPEVALRAKWWKTLSSGARLTVGLSKCPRPVHVLLHCRIVCLIYLWTSSSMLFSMLLLHFKAAFLFVAFDFFSFSNKTFLWYQNSWLCVYMRCVVVVVVACDKNSKTSPLILRK